jgi:hypothetical protein
LSDSFAGLNFKKLAGALDINNNNVIEEKEFIDLLDKSITNSMETSNYAKISQKISGSPSKKGPKVDETPESLELKVKPEHRVNA